MKIKEKEFEEILQELKAVADQLGATVRFEKEGFNKFIRLLGIKP